MFFSSSTTRTRAMARSYRELDGESAAAPDLALQEDPPAVRLHDVAHDREPEACRARLFALREALEDPLAPARRDARAAVRHREPNGSLARRERDPDHAAARRVAQRVPDQVRERPAELGAIAGDLGQV